MPAAKPTPARKSSEKSSAPGRPFVPGDPRIQRGRGPAKGAPNAGRPPDEFKARMRELVSAAQTEQALEAVLQDRGHPHFMAALKFAAEMGYGKAAQTVAHTGEGGGAIAITVTHRVIDAAGAK